MRYSSNDKERRVWCAHGSDVLCARFIVGICKGPHGTVECRSEGVSLPRARGVRAGGSGRARRGALRPATTRRVRACSALARNLLYYLTNLPLNNYWVGKTRSAKTLTYSFKYDTFMWLQLFVIRWRASTALASKVLLLQQYLKYTCCLLVFHWP